MSNIIHFFSTILKFGLFIYLIYLLVNVVESFIRLVKNKFDLKHTVFKPKLFEFLKWYSLDLKYTLKHGRPFSEFGLSLYAGKQGTGKTLSMVEYLERMRVKYPKVLIYTNFGYDHEDGVLDGWQDLVNLRNGEDGVIFAIDELQNEWDSQAYRDVPEWILTEITQQRKQKVKIVSSSQVFTRVAKQFREQCFDVIECHCVAGRWVFQKSFDAYDYEAYISSPDKKNKLHRLYRRSFVATDDIRDMYDTNLKIERIQREGFLPREQQVSRRN